MDLKTEVIKSRKRMNDGIVLQDESVSIVFKPVKKGLALMYQHRNGVRFTNLGKPYIFEISRKCAPFLANQILANLIFPTEVASLYEDYFGTIACGEIQ